MSYHSHKGHCELAVLWAVFLEAETQGSRVLPACATPNFDIHSSEAPQNERIASSITQYF